MINNQTFNCTLTMQDDLKLCLMNKRFTPIFSKLLMLFCGLFISSLVYSQGETLVCNDNIQLSLAPIDINGDGSLIECGIVTRDHFLENPISENAHVLEINGLSSIETTAGGVSYFDVDWIQYAGQTIDYKIIDAGTSNSCWGSATVEINVIDVPELPCPYVEHIHEEIKVEVPANTACITKNLETDFGIIVDDCQTVSLGFSGEAKYACVAGNDGVEGTADDGWCRVVCDVTYDPVTGDIMVCLDGSAVHPGLECVIKVTADECVDCETWCPGPIPEEMTVAEMETFLASSCFATVTKVFKKELNFGDACSGQTKVVKWSGTINQHGEEVLIDLGTQAFKISPLSLYVDGANGDRVCNLFNPDPDGAGPETGSGILVLPSNTVSLNCGDDASDLSKTGQPLIVNRHNTITSSKNNCVEVHYKEVTAIEEDSPVLIDGVWALVDKVIKTTKSQEICSPADYDKLADQVVSVKSKIGDIVEIITPKPDPWPTTTTSGFEVLTFEELSKYECNTLLSSYTNDTIPACGSGIKILRSWTLVDWCTAESKGYEQVIEIADKIAPTIDADPAEFTLSIEPWTCVADVSTADPGFSDECSTYTINVEVTDNASGIWIDASAGVGVGSYTVTMIAVDECGNESEPYESVYNIVDHVKPVPVCEDNVVVSLTDDLDGDGGLAKIYADDFDKGSHDGGCGPIHYKEVIRMDHLEGGLDCNPFTATETTTTLDKFGEVASETTVTKAVFGPHVKFCCADEGDQLVVLRVWDGVSADGASGAGNYNDCMVQVTVQNKLGATIACTDAEIICTEYTGDPTDFGGVATGGSDCASKDFTELDPIVDISSCGIGTIIRTFVLENGQLCRSTITVKGDGAFDPATIKWPLHQTDDLITVITKELDTRADSDTFGECVVTGEDTYQTTNLSCGEDAAPCEPTWTGDACGLIGVSHTDEIIEFDQDACYKIIRRWTVVDWCTWNANDGNETFDDENDTDRDTFVACSDWCTTEACNTYYRYDSVEEDGYYTFDQVIKVVDNIAPSVTCTAETVGIGIGDGCIGDITFSAQAVDGSECPSEEITYSYTVKDASGSTVDSGVGTSGSTEGLAQGTYTVSFTATDGCGNSGSTSCDVTLKEEKAPTPYCYALSTAVMNNGMVEIWASDFIQKGEDNCTAEEDLLASFSGDEYVPNLVLTCDDVTGREKNYRIYLWDEAGNADFCVQTIRVDSNGHCDETGGGNDDDDGDDDNTGGGNDDLTSISGNVSEDTNGDGVGDQGISGVTINLRDSAGNVIDTDVTDSNGNYSFTDLPAGDYLVEQSQPGGYDSVSDEDGSSDGDGGDSDTGVDNSISVTTTAGEADVDNDFVEVASDDDCDAVGGRLLTDPTDLDELTICAGDGISDAFDAKIWENVGNASWLITEPDGTIIAIPAGAPFDFEGAGEGVCYIWHVSSFGDLTGVEVGANAGDIEGCFALSNPIIVTRVTSGEACEDAAANALIGGSINTESGLPVAEAQVMLNNNVMPEYPRVDMSSEGTGSYAFMSNPLKYDYAVSASKDDEFSNGVSTLDLVLIQKHILGLQMLDSPYKVIAADVNADQRVTASDLVQLRQLILGVTDGIDSNSSWRFVDASQSFDNALSPWPFTESIDVNGLSHTMIENFIGVKTGDVSGDAKASNLAVAEVRSSGILKLSVANATIAKNDLVSVAVSSDNFSDVSGFQFTMQHAGLTLVDVLDGAISITESNIGVREGVMTMSWNDSDGVTTSDVLFTLNFKASQEIELNKVLSINSRITAAESYKGADLAMNDIELVFTDGGTSVANAEYALYQNEPNPFNANTSISFTLPQSGQATIAVYDVAGKVVTTSRGQYTKGLNTINFTRGELGGVSGVLYYQLSSGEFTATKKMIVIE